MTPALCDWCGDAPAAEGHIRCAECIPCRTCEQDAELDDSLCEECGKVWEKAE